MMHAVNKTYGDIARASAIIIVLTFADKLLAIAKEMVVASQFGISPVLDVFNIAYALPGILVLIFSGAIGQAFIPLYHEWSRAALPEEANARALALLTVALLFFSLLTTACYLLSPVIFPLIGFGFPPESQTLGIRLEKAIGFLIVIDGGGIMLASLLQAQKKFISLQTAPLFVNIISIIILIIGYPGLGIHALVWGLLLGTGCKVLFMACALRRSGFSFFKHFSLHRPHLAVFISLALPLLGSALFGNVNLLVDQIMATMLSAGSVSSLRYAFRIFDMPVQIIILAFSKALFPFISEQACIRDYDGLRDLFKQSMIFICILTFPATGAALLLAHDIVSVLFQRGAFDAHATAQTGEILILYSLGLCFYACCFVNSVYFAALKYTKPLFYMGFLSVLLNCILNYFFMQVYDVQGIALSTTLTSGVASFGFMVLLKRRLGIADFSKILGNMKRIAIACGIMLGIGFIVRLSLVSCGMGRLPHLTVTAIVMLASYAVALWKLRTTEIDSYFYFFKKGIRL